MILAEYIKVTASEMSHELSEILSEHMNVMTSVMTHELISGAVSVRTYQNDDVSNDV